MWAVVPAKRFDGAKQRLAPALSATERRALARVMLTDVLRALSAARTLVGIMVVGTEPSLAELAASHGALSVADREEGHTQAVACGLAMLRERNAGAVLVISADIPGIAAPDIERLVAEHAADAARGPAATLVTDRRNDGTNAVACTPPDCLPFAFGLGSLQRHFSAARARGVIARRIDLPNIALDMDEPDDLAAFLARSPEGATASYLHEAGIAARLAG